MKLYTFAVTSAVALAVLASAALAADNRQTVRGKVQDVQPSAHRLTIMTDQGKELTLQVDDNSRLVQRRREVALDRFEKGMEVRATYESRDGMNRVVSLRPALVSGEDVQNDIRDALQAAKSYTFQHKNEYGKRLDNVLERANDRIDQLQEQAAKGGAQAKKEMAPRIERLQRLRDKLQAQAERLRSATPAAWEDLKSGVHSALEDLRGALDKDNGDSR